MTEILDLRDPLSFAKGHLEGSINIPFAPPFLNWARMMLKPENSRILVIPDNIDPEEVKRALSLVELDCTYTIYTVTELQKYPLTSLELLNPENLDIQKQRIIDVRTPEEWKQNFIEGAIPIELSSLASQFSLIPKEGPIAVICASGTRSSIAASFLKKHHFHNVSSVKGGINAWLKMKG